MDAGAHGVIVPMVNSREDAEKAVASVQYPPAGFRGVGLARAQKYGTDFEGYKKWNQRQSIIIVQIEHIKAVENMEAILAVPGVDGFIIGPYDLSGSIGIPGGFEDNRMIELLEEIKRVADITDVTAGFHVVSISPDQVDTKISEGYTFIGFGVDFLFLGETCRSGLKRIRSLAEKAG